MTSGEAGGAVLVVEDDPQTAELERRALLRGGNRVRTVGLVGEALAAMIEDRYTAILLDYRLPDGEGWPVLEAARRALPPIPVILVTAMGDERIAAEVLHRGGADYLIKTTGFWEQLSPTIERVRKVAAIEQANARLAALVESSDDAILSLSLAGDVLSWNAGAEHLFGYTAEEVLGKPATILSAPESAPADLAITAALRRGEATRQLETTRLRRDGSSVEVSLTVSPVFDSLGQLVSASCIARDITQRRKLQNQLRQSQKMDAIGQLAGGVAHDFNNLLTIITGYADFLLSRLPPDQPGYVELSEIRRAGERAADLTRQLLTFSRQREVDAKVLDLNTVVTELDRMLRRLIGEHIELVVLPRPMLGYVRIDAGQLEQVIINLAVNARDAMSGGGRLTIETSEVEVDASFTADHVDILPGPYVVLSVTDTGTGMSAATQQRIFEPFFTTKDPGRGTGLGLATVFGIVKQSGGQIYVYSELGRGSTFKVFLPRVELAAPRTTVPSVRIPQGGAETVLVVEDDEQVRRLTCTVLRQAGYAVIEAPDGETALGVVARPDQCVDLLLTDVVMPRMAGPSLAQRMAELRPGLRVLFLSGYTGSTVGHNGSLPDEAPFLEKPFSPHSLLLKVREVLG